MEAIHGETIKCKHRRKKRGVKLARWKRTWSGRCATHAQRMNRLRETIGGIVLWMGFAVLLAAGGSTEIWEIAVFGILGLVMLVLGGWMAHAFYGQEKDAEWLRKIGPEDI